MSPAWDNKPGRRRPRWDKPALMGQPVIQSGSDSWTKVPLILLKVVQISIYDYLLDKYFMNNDGTHMVNTYLMIEISGMSVELDR